MMQKFAFPFHEKKTKNYLKVRIPLAKHVALFSSHINLCKSEN